MADNTHSGAGTAHAIRWDVLGTLACLLVATVWIDFTTIHRYHNADTVMMHLISIYHWTPLFWEQDRLGMLIPLLALPWKHPLTNLLVQSGITIFLALAGFFLLGHYVAGRRLGMVIGAVGATLLVLLVKTDQQFDYMIQMHHYATSIALGLAGLILLARWNAGASRRSAAAGCVAIIAALWVNPGVALALAPLVLVRGWSFRALAAQLEARETARGSVAPAAPAVERSRLLSRDECVALGAIAFGLALSLTLSALSPAHAQYQILSPHDWLASARGVWNYPSLYWKWFRAVEIAGAVGLVSLFWPAGRRQLRTSWRLVAGLLVAAAVQFAFMTSLDHVHRTHYGHYVFVADFLWQGALVGFCVVQLSSLLADAGWARALPLAFLGLLVVVVAARWGSPSVATVRTSLDEALGRCTHEIVSADCTHVTGDYWHVWPAVFHANLTLRGQGSPRTVWGISFRSGPTSRYWKRVPWNEVRVAEILGDESASQTQRAHYAVPPLEADSELTTIRILRPARLAGETPATWN